MMWDWPAIAAVATIIGVVGGLISLVLLIFEVRRNAQAIEGATVQSLMSFEKDVFALVANHAELYVKGSAGVDQLSAPERLAFDRIVSAQMSLLYSAYVQFQQGLIDDEVWEAYANALFRYMKQPGFAMCWKNFELSYPRSFRDLVSAGDPRADLT